MHTALKGRAGGKGELDDWDFGEWEGLSFPFLKAEMRRQEFERER